MHMEPSLNVRYVTSKDEMGKPDMIVLPGSKTTVADLDWLKEKGLDEAIISLRKSGTPVIGICGGYQMLGQRVLDPDGVESSRPEVEGLGLLPVTTTFEGTKATHQVKASVSNSVGLLAGYTGDVTGYEIHMGRTSSNGKSPFRIRERSGEAVDSMDGAMDAEGLTLGTYMHGLFQNHSLRRNMLTCIAERKGVTLPEGAILDLDKEYDKLADLVSQHIDMDMVYQMVGLKGH